MKKDQEKRLISISNGTIIKIILWGLFIAALFKIWQLVLVLLTAIVIASFVEGGVARLKRYNISRTFSVIMIYFVIMTILAGIFYLFIPLLVDELKTIIDLASRYLPAVSHTTISANNTSVILDSLSEQGPLFELVNSSQSLISRVSGNFFDVLSNVFGGVINFILIIVISFYLSMQERGIEKFLRIITPIKNEAYIIGLWQRSQRKIGLWLRGQLMLGVIVAVITYIGLLVLGVPSALVLAIIAGFFEIIPYGIFLATIPAVSFAYVDGGLSLALMVAGFYILVQQIENYFIAPMVVKRMVGVSPLVVILSILIGAKLAGFWGLILAVPVAVAILEYTNDIEKRKIEAIE